MKPTKKTKAYKATMKKIKKLHIKVMKAKDVPEGADVIDDVGDFLTLHSDGNLTLWHNKFTKWSDTKGFWKLRNLTGAKQIKIKRKKKAKPAPTPADLPSFPFKLSCGEFLDTRKWLKDNGCKWACGDDLTQHNTSTKHLYVRNLQVFSKVVCQSEWKELNPLFFEDVLVGFKVKRSDKTRLQEALDSLISANNQAQEAANTVQQIIDTMEN